MVPKVTIREVAKLAGVSPSTVSRVLNGRDAEHMRPETKARVLQAIKKLDYIPIKAARSLRKRRTQTIAVLLPDISNPFFSLLARGVASVAFKKGYSTIICDSNNSLDKESRYLDMLVAEGVEGVVFIPVGKPQAKKIERLLQHDVKIVVADRRVQGLPVVEADNFGGSYRLTNYVIRLGHQRIAYISGPEMVSTARDRLNGFIAALNKKGLRPVVIRYGDFIYESGFEHAREILKKYQVDAIMCGNDLMAIGALHAAFAVNKIVPADLAITGFDHVQLADLIRPSLTTVHVPAYEIGQTATQMLFKNTSKNIKLKVKIIVNETCAQKEVMSRAKQSLKNKSKTLEVANEKVP